jgi:hypothetical protein
MNRIRKATTLTPYQKLEQELRRTAQSETPLPRSRQRISKISKDRKYREQPAEFNQAAQPGAEPTDDDLAPEILIHEDGARSPFEEGDDMPADEAFRIVSGAQIGAGYGLDEAELAEVDPLDSHLDSK